MKTGTILFHGTDLALYGEPRFTITRTPEPAPPSRPTHYRVALEVSVELCSDMPSTTWAKARAVQALLDSTAEGTLTVRNENGTETHWLASPGSNNLDEVIQRGRGRLRMEFTALEEVAALPVTLTIDPLDGEDPVVLQRPSGWSEVVRIDRPDERVNNRSLVTTAINFSARSTYADLSKSSEARAEELLAAAAAIRALGGKEAQLQHAGMDQTVRIESITATPSEAWEYLDVSAQVSWSMLPGDSEAEVDYQATTAENPATGQIVTSIRGTVEAPDEATADAKVTAILTAYHTAARRVTRFRKTDRLLDGEDAGVTPDWTELEFEIELTEGADATRYTLKVDTNDGSGGKRITYSGTAWGSNLATIQATIATAAGGKHDVLIRSQVALNYATDDDGALKIDNGEFNYEYAVATADLFANVTTASSDGLFADRTVSISGTVAAADEGTARAWARALIPAGKCLRTDEERVVAAHYKPGGGSNAAELVNLAFTYTYFVAHATAAIGYTDTSSVDYTRMVDQRTLNGTVRAANRAACDAALLRLLTALSLHTKNPSGFTTSARRELCEDAGAPPVATDYLVALDFTYSFELLVAGTPGHDIIEASWSIERLGMVDHKPMTEIPLTKPVEQGAYGYNIGRLTASGSVKARQQATARTWGTAKRAAVATSSIGGSFTGAEDPPTERMQATHVPLDGVNVAVYEFSFTYPFRYRDGLTGQWPAALAL